MLTNLELQKKKLKEMLDNKETYDKIIDQSNSYR